MRPEDDPVISWLLVVVVALIVALVVFTIAQVVFGD